MRKVFWVLSFLLVTLYGQAQRYDFTPPLNIAGVFNTNYKEYEKGTTVLLTQVSAVNNPTQKEHKGILLSTLINNERVVIPAKDAEKVIEFKPATADEFWICEYLNHKMFSFYKKKGYYSPIRQELTEESNEYVNSISEAFYRDEYIKDYIQHIYIGIAPQSLDRKRTQRLDVEILQSPNPDIYMLPNGTLLISSGLLSTLDSVEELTAVITSEMAHYVLDHQVLNVAKERARIRRAEAWGIALSIAAIGTEIMLVENSRHYVPGGIIIGSGVANVIMTSEALQKMGMGYSDEQYFKADDISLRFLELNSMNPSALASALHKIKTYYQTENGKYALSAEGAYGNVNQRIARLGEIKESSNRSFQKAMSGVTTVNAIIQQDCKNHQAAERLVKKNIDNNLATDEDYLIWIKSNMSYTNSPADNQRNLDLIQDVKEKYPYPNLGIYKQEILLLLRMQKQSQAANALKEYMDLLYDFKQQTGSNDDIAWANEEIGWANKLQKQVMLY